VSSSSPGDLIGEACHGLSECFRQSHPEEIWSDAISFRNVLAHQYFGVDDEAVWTVVEHDLPALKQKVQDVLAESV